MSAIGPERFEGGLAILQILAAGHETRRVKFADHPASEAVNCLNFEEIAERAPIMLRLELRHILASLRGSLLIDRTRKIPGKLERELGLRVESFYWLTPEGVAILEGT